MQRRPLGRAGFDVPLIGMGTWRTFDTNEDRRPLADEALAAGIDLFDSSPMYGKAERTLARALDGRREQALVATKVWSDDPAEGRRQAENALALFGRVDIYQVHNLVAWEAQLALLEGLKQHGRVRAVGASHYQEQAFEPLAALMRTGRLDMVQIPYNPRRRLAERTLLPLAAELGLGVLVMSPLQGGILDAGPAPAELERLGVATWAQAVLKWIASDSRVSCVLTATRTPGRPAENAEAGQPPLFDERQRALVAEIATR